MEHGVCTWMSVALRAEASHRAEMVSQLLFGETYSVVECADEWLKITTHDCSYEGWLQKKQHTPLTEDELNELQHAPRYFVRDTFLYVRNAATHIAFPVCIGSSFPMPEEGRFVLGGHAFTVELPESSPTPRHEGLTPQQDDLLAFAFHYLNAPYLWGGRTPAGIDCSGFVQMVFRSLGINLPRDASQQINHGEVVDFVEEAQIGDVAFFANDEGHIVHTGIVCGHQQIIHASGHVQINTLDENGIFNQSLGRYTHTLRIIKRIL
ncbi:MAG: C40 family peptidase [Bacteroidales bacterium]|nr:C40 family peptidase [Bacteroidales bacterium]